MDWRLIGEQLLISFKQLFSIRWSEEIASRLLYCAPNATSSFWRAYRFHPIVMALLESS